MKKESYIENAMASGNDQEAKETLADGTTYYARQLVDIFNRMNKQDVPLFLVAMRLLDNNIKTINPNNNVVAQDLQKKMSSVMVAIPIKRKEG